jgi:phosphatidate phosphatase APP1
MLSDIPQNIDKFRKKSRPFRFKRWIRKKLNWINYPFINAYRGFGNAQTVYVYGHVFRSLYWISERKTDSFVRNGLRMLKRFLMKPIKNVRVEIQVGKERYYTSTNHRGYFFMGVPNPGFKDGWHDYRVRLKDLPEAYEDEDIKVVEEFLIPHQSEYAFISDIDDTFLVSHSTSFFKKVFHMLSKNVESRNPFQGVQDHYRRLMKGLNPDKPNPFFYVSSSEWNLYDFIVEFCEINTLPKGVFLLRDLKVGLHELLRQSGGNHNHKELKFKTILETYPAHRFVLLGDSGQRDPEIYHRIVSRFPEQVEAVYIRDMGKRKRSKTRKIGERIAQYGVHFVLFEDSSEAFEHSETHLFNNSEKH